MKALLLPFKCKKYSTKWKKLKNVAIICSKNQEYKSNTVIVYNKKCKKCYKTKVIYCCEDCNNIYRIKVIKYVKCEQIYYKICIMIYCKTCKKKYKKKFYIYKEGVLK